MLNNLRISTKIAMIAVFISLLGIAASFYASSVIRSSDSDYSEMIERLDKSAIFLARLNRTANAVGYAAYRVIAYDGASAEAQSAAAMAKDQFDAMKSYFGEVTARLTDEADALKALGAKMDFIAERTNAAIATGLRNDDEAARAIMTAVDPAVVDLSKQTSTLNDRLIKRVAAASASLTDQASSAAWMLRGGSIASAVLGLMLALWMSRRAITAPLAQLQGRMVDLAGGRLDVEVTGQDRGDEIGGMARTVQVFKDAAVQNRRLEAEAEAARAAELARLEREAAAERVKAQDLAAFVAGIEGGFARLSAGDLTARMDEAVAPEFEPIREQFNGSVG
ncbi:HAMP domain-containing protein, partial [uncultured Aureimonas sp.]|uniref:HAMP domain-containing protein n=1 Tax=uncultured Aureimonas sp. TaxID=1604662 RepID=UPI0025E9A4C7